MKYWEKQPSDLLQSCDQPSINASAHFKSEIVKLSEYPIQFDKVLQW